MKKLSAFLLSSLFCLLSFDVHAAEKDAPDCKDHPLLPRMPGFYILGCAGGDANFDMEAAPGKPAETTHVEGKSTAILYSAQPELKARPSRQQILGNFEKGIRQYGGTLIGMVNATPVYKVADGGREVWVIVMADNEGGGHAYRIIEKGDLVLTKKDESQRDDLNCKRYASPLFTLIPGYLICGCGESESRTRDVKIAKGKTQETIRIRGAMTQVSYCPQEESAAKNNPKVRRSFENDIRKHGGAFIGKTVKAPGIDVYKLNKGGKETWIEVWTEENGNYNYAVTQ